MVSFLVPFWLQIDVSSLLASRARFPVSGQVSQRGLFPFTLLIENRCFEPPGLQDKIPRFWPGVPDPTRNNPKPQIRNPKPQQGVLLIIVRAEGPEVKMKRQHEILQAASDY